MARESVKENEMGTWLVMGGLVFFICLAIKGMSDYSDEEIDANDEDDDRRRAAELDQQTF